jgi:hypothetical protein
MSSGHAYFFCAKLSLRGTAGLPQAHGFCVQESAYTTVVLVAANAFVNSRELFGCYWKSYISFAVVGVSPTTLVACEDTNDGKKGNSASGRSSCRQFSKRNASCVINLEKYNSKMRFFYANVLFWVFLHKIH